MSSRGPKSRSQVLRTTKFDGVAAGHVAGSWLAMTSMMWARVVLAVCRSASPISAPSWSALARWACPDTPGRFTFDAGGHDPAHQVPEILAGDMREFFTKLS